MKKILILLLTLIFFVAMTIPAITQGPPKEQEPPAFTVTNVEAPGYIDDDIHIPFILNQGQIDERVKFYAKIFGGTVFITKDGKIFYSFQKINEKKMIKELVLKEELVGGKVDEIKGEGKAITTFSYFKGNDPLKWKSNVPTYKSVSIGEVYEGIELKLKACGNTIEKLFYVKPGAEPKKIRIKLSDAESLKVNDEGELEVKSDFGDVKFTKPIAYQEKNGKKKYIEVAYSVKGDEYSFNVGDYDRTKELVIDPLLFSSTYLGGAGRDEADSICMDEERNVYVAGRTLSADFPASSSAGLGGDYDVFVAKLDRHLTTLLAATIVGGDGWDSAASITTHSDPSGNTFVYVTGYTSSPNFPNRPSAVYDTSYNGNGDAFILKVESYVDYYYPNYHHLSLRRSTYLGGSNSDAANSIAITWRVYVTGHTVSSDFPTTSDAYDRSFNGGETDAFIATLDLELENLYGSTYLGGRGTDIPWSMDIYANDVYVAGRTCSDNFPADGYRTYLWGSSDAFVSRLDLNLTNLSVSTYLGGGGPDEAKSIYVTGQGLYVAGWTGSRNFRTTTNAYDRSFNGGETDAFVVRLNRWFGDLGALEASTYLGGSGNDHAESITVTGGDVHVTGVTGSEDFPTTSDVYDTSYNGNGDAFIAHLDEDLEDLSASTYLGGNDNDHANSILVTGMLRVYVAGATYSSDFPTSPIAFHDDTLAGYGGDGDAFVSKLGRGLSLSRRYPNIWVHPTNHDFGNIYIDESSTLSVHIDNIGPGVLSISNMTLEPPTWHFTLDVTGGGNPCNSATTTILPSSYCTVSVKFRPQWRGTFQTTLAIYSDDPDAYRQGVSLTGKGALPEYHFPTLFIIIIIVAIIIGTID